MNESSTDYIHHLLSVVPELREVYAEHIEDNDSLLPHVLFGDVTRFVISEARKGGHSSAMVRLLDQLESGLRDGDSEVNELIGVSFVENLLGEVETVRYLKPLMGERLRTELAIMCGEEDNAGAGP